MHDKYLRQALLLYRIVREESIKTYSIQSAACDITGLILHQISDQSNISFSV